MNAEAVHPGFRIVDAVYGPPLGEALPATYAHRLPLELQRRVGPQLVALLQQRAWGSDALLLPAGSLNSVFG